METPRWPRVAVFGAGAVGCYFGGMLARAGAPVTLIARSLHAQAIRREGLTIERESGRETIHLDATTAADAAHGADVVLVCVKSQDSESAALALAPHLDPRTVLVSMQNGVDNAARFAAIVDNPVLAAVVYVGTYMTGPGIVHHAGRGDLVLGVPRDCASRDDMPARRDDVARMFERAGIGCPVTDDIEGALWTKLVVNCAFNAISALGRSRYGRMAREPSIRDVMESAVREAVAVAGASGVEMDEPRLIATVWNVADAMSEQYSSTAQDVLRGKRTEIDALNGYVAERAAALGIAAPVNRTLHALVKLREGGDDLA
jgi:2-dehydropantoate 2-reductase